MGDSFCVEIGTIARDTEHQQQNKVNGFVSLCKGQLIGSIIIILKTSLLPAADSWLTGGTAGCPRTHLSLRGLRAHICLE